MNSRVYLSRSLNTVAENEVVRTSSAFRSRRCASARRSGADHPAQSRWRLRRMRGRRSHGWSPTVEAATTRAPEATPVTAAISGRVVNEKGQGQQGFVVEIIGVQGARVDSVDSTDAAGFFGAVYDEARTAALGKAGSLFLRVIDAAGKEIFRSKDAFTSQPGADVRQTITLPVRIVPRSSVTNATIFPRKVDQTPPVVTTPPTDTSRRPIRNRRPIRRFARRSISSTSTTRCGDSSSPAASTTSKACSRPIPPSWPRLSATRRQQRSCRQWPRQVLGCCRRHGVRQRRRQHHDANDADNSDDRQPTTRRRRQHQRRRQHPTPTTPTNANDADNPDDAGEADDADNAGDTTGDAGNAGDGTPTTPTTPTTRSSRHRLAAREEEEGQLGCLQPPDATPTAGRATAQPAVRKSRAARPSARRRPSRVRAVAEPALQDIRA